VACMCARVFVRVALDTSGGGHAPCICRARPWASAAARWALRWSAASGWCRCHWRVTASTHASPPTTATCSTERCACVWAHVLASGNVGGWCVQVLLEVMRRATLCVYVCVCMCVFVSCVVGVLAYDWEVSWGWGWLSKPAFGVDVHTCACVSFIPRALRMSHAHKVHLWWLCVPSALFGVHLVPACRSSSGHPRPASPASLSSPRTSLSLGRCLWARTQLGAQCGQERGRVHTGFCRIVSTGPCQTTRQLLVACTGLCSRAHTCVCVRACLDDPCILRPRLQCLDSFGFSVLHGEVCRCRTVAAAAVTWRVCIRTTLPRCASPTTAYSTCTWSSRSSPKRMAQTVGGRPLTCLGI